MKLYFFPLVSLAALLALSSTQLLAQSVQDVNDGTFTRVVGSTPNLSYDTGGFLQEVAPGYVYSSSVITGYDGAGGFVLQDTPAYGQSAYIDVGGTLDWQNTLGGKALILGAGIEFENPIFLGNDSTATRQIDIGAATTNSSFQTLISGPIYGSGNLLIQNYVTNGPYLGVPPALTWYYSASQEPPLDISGQLVINNVDLLLRGFATNGAPANGLVSAAGYSLSGAELQSNVAGTPDMTLSNQSQWIMNVGTQANQSLGT